MHVHSIAIADPPLRSSYGLHAPYALRTILELKSEVGVAVIAETYGGAINSSELAKLAAEELRPRGPDFFVIEGTRRERGIVLRFFYEPEIRTT